MGEPRWIDVAARHPITRWVERGGSELAIIDDAGHFLQLEQPEVVARHIVDFVGRAA